MKVILNPAHSSQAPGLIGPTGLTEREVVEAVARHLATALGQRMIQTEIMQPPPGEAEEAAGLLLSRIADEPYDVDLLLSLHCGSHPDSAAYGLCCRYLPGSEESRLLADCLLRAFPRTRWSAALPGDDPLLRRAPCPAVLVELDFLTSPEVEQLMRSPSWQAKVADNLVAGILAFRGPQDIRILVDGAEIYIDPAPQQVYNDVMVPVRVIGWALGAEVHWDPRRRVVRIESGRREDPS